MPDGNEKIDRRTVLKTTGSLTAGGMLAGCSGGDGGDGGGGDTPEPTPTPTPTATPKPTMEGTIASVGFDLTVIPQIAAINEILPSRTKERFTSVYRSFSSGQLLMRSLVAGELDASVGSLGPVFTAAQAGNDPKIVATDIAGTDYVMAVRSDVNSLEEFAEKDLSFGISSPGAISHVQPVGVFQKEGIDISQVNFVKIGGSSARTKAVAAGRIAGAAIHFGQMERLKSQGADVKSLGDVREWFPNFVQQPAAVLGSALEDPLFEKFTQAYVTATYRAHQKANNSFEWLFKRAQKYQAQPIQRKDAKSVWELQKEINGWPVRPIEKEPYQSVLDMMSAAGIVDKSQLNLDDLIEPKFAEEAVNQLT